MTFLKRLFILFTTTLLLAVGLCGVTVAAQPGPAAATTYMLRTADGLTLTLSADGRALGLTLQDEALPVTAGPLLWVRDMSRAGQVIAPNLLPNPGFEAGMQGWRISQHIDTAITVTTAVHHSGDRALQMTAGPVQRLGAGALVTTPAIPITPGQRYRLSGYFLSSRGYVQGVSGTPPVRQDQMWRGLQRPNGLYVRWLDAQGGQVGPLTLVAPLHWNARNWRRIGGEVRAPAAAAQMEVIIGGRLQDEMLWVDDLSVVASPEVEMAVTGEVRPCEGEQTEGGEANCLQQVATPPEAGLALTATYTAAADHIGVHVAVRDTRGEDRALEVVWGLPLALTDEGGAWRWWDDVRHSRVIHPGSVADPPQYPLPPGLSWVYEHVVSGVWDGWLPVSLYPYALVEDGDQGLALATSLASPRLIKLAYDQEKGRYEARSYLGMSPQAVKVGPVADFSLELYRVQPEWGFRAAMDAFARRHPDWFDSPRSLADYVDYERGNYTSPEGAQQALANDGEGVFTAEYIVADAPLDIAPVSEPRPTYTETLTRVHELAQSPRASDRAQAEAITQSVATSANGDWQIKHIDEFEWAQGKWQAVWHTSVDPDIAGGWGPFQWTWNIERSISATEAIGAVLDGVMMDNYLSAPGVDLRPEHLTLTDAPLTYDVTTYRPGVHNMVNMDEFFAWLRRQLHARGRDDMAIAINFWGVATPNATARWIDAFGGEGKSSGQDPTNWNPRILDYRRAIAYHKPQTWTNGEKNLTLADAQAYIARALFYGIFPTRKEEATGWESGADEALAAAQQLQRRYAAAGWEPLTYARSSDEAVWIERFGALRANSATRTPQSEIGLYFTIYNQTDVTRTTTLTLESAALEIPDPNEVALTDIAITQTIPFRVTNGDIRFDLTLDPRQTRVVQVGGAAPPIPLYLPVMHIFATSGRWTKNARPSQKLLVHLPEVGSPP